MNYFDEDIYGVDEDLKEDGGMVLFAIALIVGIIVAGVMFVLI